MKIDNEPHSNVNKSEAADVTAKNEASCPTDEPRKVDTPWKPADWSETDAIMKGGAGIGVTVSILILLLASAASTPPVWACILIGLASIIVCVPIVGMLSCLLTWKDGR